MKAWKTGRAVATDTFYGSVCPGGDWKGFRLRYTVDFSVWAKCYFRWWSASRRMQKERLQPKLCDLLSSTCFRQLSLLSAKGLVTLRLWQTSSKFCISATTAFWPICTRQFAHQGILAPPRHLRSRIKQMPTRTGSLNKQHKKACQKRSF